MVDEPHGAHRAVDAQGKVHLGDVDAPTGTSFVGHEWDGIRELDTPMPRWWLLTFFATILWGIWYVIWYPAVPLANSATKGVSGWTSHGQFNAEMKADAARRAPMLAALASTPIEDIAANRQLHRFAVEGGRAAYKVNCVQCHGSGHMGSRGYPNLNDDDWLWGGDLKSIEYTITHGIRNPDHAETRQSAMPAYGAMFSAAEIGGLVGHVQSLAGIKGGQSTPAAAKQFAENCAACHGVDGKGLRQFGAPNLTDGIWLYGNQADDIRNSISAAHQGVMPRWGHRLDPVTIKMLALYVHGLGGGEAASAAPVDRAGADPLLPTPEVPVASVVAPVTKAEKSDTAK